MLAQIQPHFLFNSLLTIRHLCRKNPGAAEKAILEFITFLRYNMESLSTERAILFTEELGHTKAYLALQKLRFGDDMKVEYDHEFTSFRIPTLTLQPLVENAVSYGIRKSESGQGQISISSRKYPDRIEVSVSDDGPGFAPDEILPTDTGGAHIGIQNVRERLKEAGAQLVIDSVVGKGTKATIILPQEKET